MINRQRAGVVGLVLSASAFVGILNHEGYFDVAAPPVKGDACTYGFGTTEGVKCGDRITPPKAVNRALTDVSKFEGAIKQCVQVPLAQNEYDAYVSLAYNIGPTAFCNSSLVKKLNAKDYAGACQAILSWDKFQGRTLPGLTRRRLDEYHQCIGT